MFTCPTSGAEARELRAELQTVTGELLALRGWLKGLGVTHVAMEATGVYWKPVYNLLEDDFELWSELLLGLRLLGAPWWLRGRVERDP